MTEMREKREMRGGDMKRGFSNGKQILAVQFKYLFFDFQKYDRCGHVKPSLALIFDVLLRVFWLKELLVLKAKFWKCNPFLSHFNNFIIFFVKIIFSFKDIYKYMK